MPGAARSCQELPGAARSYQELAGAARSCQELPGANYQELPGATRRSLELPGAARSCPQLPEAARSYQELSHSNIHLRNHSNPPRTWRRGASRGQLSKILGTRLNPPEPLQAKPVWGKTQPGTVNKNVYSTKLFLPHGSAVSGGGAFFNQLL